MPLPYGRPLHPHHTRHAERSIDDVNTHPSPKTRFTYVPHNSSIYSSGMHFVGMMYVLVTMMEWPNNRFYAHRLIVSPHLTGIRTRRLTGAPLHSISRCPTSTGAVHKSVTCRCVFMLVQLIKCVVCGSVLQRA